MTTPLDPYAAASTNLPSATQSIIPASGLGLNSATINTSDLNVSSNGGGVVLGYAGSPGVGNLYFSLSPTSSNDQYGNSVPTGLNVNAGQLTGVSLIGIQMDSTSTLQNTQINQGSILSPQIAGGTAASMTQTMTNAGGGVLGYTSAIAAQTFATSGNYLWTCPTGVTTLNVQCIGGGGGGGGGGSDAGTNTGGESGGGGEFAGEPALSVTPGAVYSVIVGAGGAGGTTGYPGQDGQPTVFQNQNGGGTSVYANQGLAGVDFIGGVGGSGSTNSVHFDGGDGANASGNTGGAGGGASASPTSEGADGTESASSSGGAPGSNPPGGSGGTGGNDATNGSNAGNPGGGGGGAGYNVVVTGSYTYGPNDNATYSYYGSDATEGNAEKLHDGPNGPLYVGLPLTASDPQSYGHQYSFFPFPYGTIMSNLAGKNVTSVSLKIKCLYTYYSSGVYNQVYTYGANSFGNTAAVTPRLTVSTFLIKQNVTATVNLGLGGGGSLGTNLQSGAARSFMFGSGGVNDLTPSGDYYGSFDDGQNGGVQPKLIVYYNEGGGSTAGSGGTGQVILTYNSGTVPTYTLSVASQQAADVFGNPYNQGFTGPQLTLTPSNPLQTTIATAVNAAANTSATSVTVSTSSSFAGSLPISQVDTQPHTNANAGSAAITKQWLIPAGDAQLGSIYKMEVPFVCVFESETIQWKPALNGTTIATSGGDLTGPAGFVGGTTIVGYMNMKMMCTSVGTSGQVQFFTDGGVGVDSNRSSGSNCNFLLLSAQNTGVAFNTTVNNTVALNAIFGASASGQSVIGNGSLFYRFGP